nr:M23 family metallopeptidase [Ardenticatena sp.]
MKQWWIGLIVMVVMLGLVAGGAARVQAERSRAGAPVYRNEILGVSLQILPPETHVVVDQYLSDTFGFTVVDRGGRMVLRVAWRHRDTPNQMAQRAQELVRGFSDLNLRARPVSVGSHEGIMIADVPGMDPSLYLYLAAHGRLYEIICPQRPGDGQRCETLLTLLSFDPATRSLSELRLIRAEDALYETPPVLEFPQPKGPGRMESPEGKSPHSVGNDVFSVEPQAAPGCADWPTWKFLQTPWASTANGPGTSWPQGWSQAGPSYYGERFHRYCNRTNGLNDYHALDFPLKEWDSVYPPASGQVLYAGWARGGWAGLGRVVIVDLGNGYWSMAAHLRRLDVSAGQQVGISTVIGYAGRSGYYQDGSWPSNHLHQGLYLNAQLYQPDGSVYGGQSVEPHHVRYFGNGGGYYETIRHYQWMSW